MGDLSKSERVEKAAMDITDSFITVFWVLFALAMVGTVFNVVFG